jgi:hypothetical protein
MQVAIEQRGPEELEVERQRHQGKDADGLDADTARRQPRLHREAGQVEGQTGRKAHQQHGHHALVAEGLPQGRLDRFSQTGRSVDMTVRMARDNISPHDLGISK